MGEDAMSARVMSITVGELCEQTGVTRSMVVQLVEHAIAQPLTGASVDDWVFDVNSAQWLTRAIRLQRDLDLEWMAVAMLIDLLRERDALTRENQCLRQRLQRFVLDEDA
jgi:chaperone modulatory protein CbpM